MATVDNLWFVMPVYNEEEAISATLDEWFKALENNKIKYVFLVLNDGSSDGTSEVLTEYTGRKSNLRVINKLNSGHGQTCVEGYRYALENGAQWIFQIDSDGQCDPVYLNSFINETIKHKCIYGYRKLREDGYKRIIISRFLTFLIFAIRGVWIKDPNVPYRLMHKDILSKVVGNVPSNFYLANIYVSILCQQTSKIKWIPIEFRQRLGGGVCQTKISYFMREGWRLFNQLRLTSK